MKRFAYICIGVVLFGGFFLSCGSEPGPPQLTARQRERVDTMMMQAIKTLRPELDSFCETSMDEWVASAVDSMYKIRKVEEEILRKRMIEQVRQKQGQQTNEPIN